MITAAVRARMCESLAEASGQHPQTAFTVGLFSVLDAVMDRPMAQALDLLPLSDEICDALIDYRGPLSEVLKCVLAYEQSDWHGVKLGNLSGTRIGDSYLDSVDWTRTHTSALGI